MLSDTEALHTVMFVDDEKNVLNSLKRLLRKEPYRVLTANNGDEALNFLDSEDIQIVVSDQRMPDIEGTQLLAKIKEKKPDTVRVILSGYADVSVIVQAINQGEVFRFMGKPWNGDELKAMLRQCIEHYEMVQQNASLLEQTQLQNKILEEMIQRQNISLQMAQQVFEDIPFPVIGMDSEGGIVTANTAAHKGFKGFASLMPGSSYTDVMPQDIVSTITEAIHSPLIEDVDRNNEEDGESWVSYSETMNLEFMIKRMKRGNEIRGYLLTMWSAKGMAFIYYGDEGNSDGTEQ